jgi:hypothetical protein
MAFQPGVKTQDTQKASASPAVVQPTGKAPILFGKHGFEPTDLDGAWRIATMVAQSGLAPTHFRNNPAAICVAAAMGAELGFTFLQSLRNIAVINGRPSVWGDLALALVMRSGLVADFREWIEGDEDTRTAICAGKRTGMPEGRQQAFSVADAKKAGLWGKQGPWTQYPDRMLQMRARGFLLRDLWPDVMTGFVVREEAMDLPPEDLPPLDAVITEVRPETVTVKKNTEPEEPTPKPEARRAPSRRRRVVTRFNGKEIKTAGISGKTLDEVTTVREGHALGPEITKDFFEQLAATDETFNLGAIRQRKEPPSTYLREEEGLALLHLLRPTPANNTPTDEREERATLKNGYPAPVEEEWRPADKVAPVINEPAQDDPMIPCPEEGMGGSRRLSWCENSCKVRDGCPSHEMPPTAPWNEQ